MATTDSTAEVVEEAEKLRNRWSSFQQGRRSAGPATESEVDSRPAAAGEHE
ncbi:MAG: hypothetical protein OEV40_24330 [Acidimicrobiia bacterium]|nr:hypothetical protein [Acidimicrobiia bacterium]